VKQQQTSSDPSVRSESDSETTPAQAEKRSHARYAVSVEAEVIARTSGRSTSGTVTDVGIGGFFVDTAITFPEGTETEVRLRWEGRRFRCRAIVTHVIDGRGMGLSFTETDPDQNISLMEWVNTLREPASAVSAHR
jgi:PilZ domain